MLDAFSRAIGDKAGPPDVMTLSYGGCAVAEAEATPSSWRPSTTCSAWPRGRGVDLRGGGDSGSTSASARIRSSGRVPVVPGGVGVRHGRRRHGPASGGATGASASRVERHPLRRAGRGRRRREQARAPSAVPGAGVVHGRPHSPGCQRAGRHLAGMARRHRCVAAHRRWHEWFVAAHGGGYRSGAAKERAAGRPPLGLANGWFYSVATRPEERSSTSCRATTTSTASAAAPRAPATTPRAASACPTVPLPPPP